MLAVLHTHRQYGCWRISSGGIRLLSREGKHQIPCSYRQCLKCKWAVSARSSVVDLLLCRKNQPFSYGIAELHLCWQYQLFKEWPHEFDKRFAPKTPQLTAVKSFHFPGIVWNTRNRGLWHFQFTNRAQQIQWWTFLCAHFIPQLLFPPP